MKKTITIPVGKIMSVVAMGEGVCATALVDNALKVVPMNPIVKSFGRAAVMTAVGTPFSISAVALWNSKVGIKIGGDKDSTGKRIENKDLEEMIKCIEEHNEYYLSTFYKGSELVTIERINIAVKRGVVDAVRGCQAAAKIFKAMGAEIDEKKIEEFIKPAEESTENETAESGDKKEKGLNIPKIFHGVGSKVTNSENSKEETSDNKAAEDGMDSGLDIPVNAEVVGGMA